MKIKIKSDKKITKQSGYLDMMEPYTELMVDKGFNISNECAAKRIYVVAPQENKYQIRCCPQKLQKQIKFQKHRYLLSKPFDDSKFLDLLQMKFRLTCLVILMTYCICASISNMQSSLYG